MLTARKLTSLAYLALFGLLLARSALAAVVIQSPADKAQYEVFNLPNKMQVLLVSDSSLDKAAAAMNVEVGSMDNPDDRLGIAHFLEHMLFLGTQKYPQADSYQKFISTHGGSNNAYTADENTNFFFDVKADALPEALDRFSQFFIAPLFSPKYVDRERHAVYSEYEAKWRDDGRRLYTAAKLTMNQQHPLSRFAVGDLKTLGDRPNDPVRDDLVKFYNTHYSANLMHLVIMGPQSLDTLKKLAREHFTAVPNHDFQPTRSKVALYDTKRLPMQLDVKTLSDHHLIRLTFPIDPVRPHWQSKPLEYLANIIGYEGKGSLLSRLKTLGWADGLGASTGTDLPNNSDFQVSIQLTEAGFKHYDQVVELFFDYIEKLKANGVSEMLYNQQSQISATDFRFMEKGEPMHAVTRLSSLLTRYPATHVLDGSYLMNDFDADLIQHYLQQMTPKNLILLRAAQEIPTDKTTPRYRIDYHLGAINKDTLAQWQHPKADPALKIPGRNPFVATDFNLIEKNDDFSHPQAIWEQSDARLWYMPDTDFDMPKSDLFFALLTPEANRSARAAVLSELYAQVTRDRLNETLYDADLAGLSTRIYAHLRGISVRISGYNDKQQTLLKAVVKGMKQLPESEARFNRIKQSLKDSLENAAKERPYNQGYSALYNTLIPSWTEQQQLAALKTISFKDLQEFTPKLFNHSYLRVLAHGNIQQASATRMAETIRSGLLDNDNKPAQSPLPVLQLPTGQVMTKLMDIDHNDSLLMQYLQAGELTDTENARVMLLSELLSTPFYNELRTQQQLGYIVFSNYLPVRRVPGMALVVESPKKSPQELLKAQNDFLDQAEQQLTHLTAEQLTMYKQSLLSRINREDTSLNDRSGRFWQAIDHNDEQFDYRKRLSNAVNKVTPAGIVATLKSLRTRTLLVENYGNAFKSKTPKKDDSEKLQQQRDKKHWVKGAKANSLLPVSR